MPATAPWKVLACAILISSIAQTAFAAVSRIEILHREPLAGGKSFGKAGAYELITGRLHYALNPASPANDHVVDLKLAARDPQLASGSLGTVAAYRRLFPKLPSLKVPTHNLSPPRLDHGARFETEGIADLQPALPGQSFTTLVPLPDEDGQDRGGIRLPQIAVPLGTYLGWNLRRNSLSRARLGRWEGSFVPFHATEGLRRLVGDPRRSIEERYPTKQRFLTATSAAANELVRQRFLLKDDVPTILARGRRAYHALTNADVAHNCNYLGHWRPN